MGKVQFTQSAVAFLDVLGFKSFIEAAERDGSLEGVQFGELQKVISHQLHFVQAEDCDGNVAIELHRFPKDVGLRVLHVSDSFVLSAPIESETYPAYSGMVAVSIKSIQLAHQLLKMGFLIRGGLAVGNVHRTESNIFGTGYQAAYETERCAVTPRVLFHQSAAEHFETASHFGIPLSQLSIFAKEGSEIILDTLVAQWCYVGEDQGADVVDTFRSHKEIIQQRLSGLPSGRPREKWEWMAKYFNAKLHRASEVTPVGAIEIDKYSVFRFGPLTTHSESTFAEAFGSFMGPPSGTEDSNKVQDIGGVTGRGE